MIVLGPWLAYSIEQAKYFTKNVQYWHDII